MAATQRHDGAEPLLLPRIAAGDRAAVTECIDRYASLVWTMARRLTPTAEDAEEAVQDIFLDIWRYASRFDAARGPEHTGLPLGTVKTLIRRGILRARAVAANVEAVSKVAGKEP